MRYETTTKLPPPDALALARSFFARDLGLAERSPEGATAIFEGGGGAVVVSAASRDGGSTVEVVSREWDYQAREFLRLLHAR
jgi:hypothetical protein